MVFVKKGTGFFGFFSNNKEFLIVLFISFVFLFLSQIPLISGFLTQGDDEVFMGIPVHVTDANNHLNWALQAREGHLLFTNGFTSENVPALIFNPFHLLIGSFSRFSGLPLIFAYNLVGMLFIIIFVFVLYYFIGFFFPDFKTRIISLIIVLSSSGFGFFWVLSRKFFGKWLVSSELWITELNTFQSFGHPHFVLSMILILIVLLFYLRSVFENNSKLAFIASFFLLLLTSVHIFDVVTIAFVIVFWIVFSLINYLFNKSDGSWFLFLNSFRMAFFTALLSIPMVGYYFWVFFLQPSYRAWNSLNLTITPPFLELVSGLGLLFFFSLIMVFIILKRGFLFDCFFSRKGFFSRSDSGVKNGFFYRFVFLIIWAFANFVLVYLPLNVQRRFLLGIHVPFSLLSSFFIIYVLIPALIIILSSISSGDFKRLFSGDFKQCFRSFEERVCSLGKMINEQRIYKKRIVFNSKAGVNSNAGVYWFYSLLLIIILLLSATNVYLTFQQVSSLHKNPSSVFGNKRYLSVPEFNLLMLIDNSTNDSDVIIAPYYLSNYIPAVSGNKVYCGHWAQTINFSEKCRVISKFYNDSLSNDWLLSSMMNISFNESINYYVVKINKVNNKINDLSLELLWRGVR